ncbi:MULTISPECIES: hypothetical protein [Kitasatospora]
MRTRPAAVLLALALAAGGATLAGPPASAAPLAIQAPTASRATESLPTEGQQRSDGVGPVGARARARSLASVPLARGKSKIRRKRGFVGRLVGTAFGLVALFVVLFVVIVLVVVARRGSRRRENG